MIQLLLSLLLFGVFAGADAGSWKATDLMSPAQLAAEIKAGHPARKIFFVGYPILYKGAHIPGASFAGPASKPEGLDLLREQVKGLSRATEIVIYCGCCPMLKCPNVHPAFQALQAMGFDHVKVLQLDTSLHTDWVEKGYPTDHSSEPAQ